MGKIKKILTIDDLVNFCLKSGMNKFSSNECGYQLSVQVPALFENDKVSEDDTMLYAFVRLFHIGLNRNGSSVTREAAEKSLDGIKYKPILANFTTNTPDGDEDFTSHDMEIDDDGNIVYIEKQVGCFTADEPYIANDEETGKDFVYAKIAIPREYTSAASIIERKNGTKISVELLINDMQFDAKEKLLELTDIIVQGATLLGTNPNTGEPVEEGMKNAKVSLEDFSQKNNSVFSGADINEKLIESLDKLNETLSNFNKTNVNCQFTKKGGNCMDKLNELLEKYSKTLEDIDFEYENMSDEELEAKFAEMFEESGSSTEGADGETSEEGSTENDVEGLVEGAKPEENSTDESNENGSEEEGNYSIEISDGKRTYSVSMNDKIYALNQLVNEVYAEDGTYYSVIAYDDCVVMSDWWSGRNYRQSYKDENDELTLLGDREEVFVNYLTREEEASLEEMKSNYSAIKNELNTYKKAELDTKKNEIFAEESYSEYLGEDEFKELIEHKDDYSLEELRDKSEIAFAKCVKKSGTFSKKEPEKKTVRHGLFSNKNTEEKKPYGDLFD